MAKTSTATTSEKETPVADESQQTPDDVVDVEEPTGDEETPPEGASEADDQPRTEETDEQPQIADEEAPEEEVVEQDPTVIAKALSVGLTPDEIAGLGDHLGVTVSIMSERMQAPAPAAQSQQQAPPPKQAEEAAETERREKAFEIALSEDDVDPNVIKQFKDLTEHFQDRIGELTTQVSQLTSAQQAQSQSQFVEWFDGEIGELPDEFNDLLGKEARESIDEGSPHYKNRVELAQQMDTIEKGRRAAGLPALKPKALFNQALNSVFNEQVTQLARKKVGAAVKKRSKLIATRPTQRVHGTDTSPEKRAIMAVKEQMAKAGVPVTETLAEDEIDEF